MASVPSPRLCPGPSSLVLRERLDDEQRLRAAHVLGAGEVVVAAGEEGEGGEEDGVERRRSVVERKSLAERREQARKQAEAVETLLTEAGRLRITTANAIEWPPPYSYETLSHTHVVAATLIPRRPFPDELLAFLRESRPRDLLLATDLLLA